MDKKTWIGLYVIDEQGEPVPCYDTIQWGRWFEKADRHIALTDLGERGRVSTVFLGLDHSWGPMLDPLTYRAMLWETMVFGGPCDMDMRRYRSREEAERGHQEMVKQCVEIA